MTAWLTTLVRCLESGETCMLVSVVAKTGSSPRGTDAKMMVTESAVDGTIGGGELEYRAIGEARELLPGTRAGKRDTALLGPDLGQCCGGAVALMFERFGPRDLPSLRDAATQLAAGQTLRRIAWVLDDGSVERYFEPANAPAGAAEIPRDAFVELINDNRAPLWVFGGGHVGSAIIRAMHGLPFALTWIDGRRGIFPDEPPAGVELITPDAVADVVVDAPAAAWYLVMTHSHALDEAICEQVLRRGDAAYLGLIGSRTKRARFEHRIAARGVGARELSAMHSPIGLPGITGKAPAVIAASVAADLLMRLDGANDGEQKSTLGTADETGRTRAYAQGH